MPVSLLAHGINGLTIEVPQRHKNALAGMGWASSQTSTASQAMVSKRGLNLISPYSSGQIILLAA